MALLTNQQHHEQVRQLLTDAVTMLCKNMLTFTKDLCIEGLIGITTDKTNVILVNIKEMIRHEDKETEEEDNTPDDVTIASFCPFQPTFSRPKHRRKSNNSETRNQRTPANERQDAAVATEMEKQLNEKEVYTMQEEDENAMTDDGKKETSEEVEKTIVTVKQEFEFSSDFPCIRFERSNNNNSNISSSSCTWREQLQLPGHKNPRPNFGINDTEPFQRSVWQNAGDFDVTKLSSLFLPSSSSSLMSWPSRTTRASLDEIPMTLSESRRTSHSNRPTLVMGRDRNFVKYHRTLSSDHVERHAPLSFTIQNDPNGIVSELFVCECGEPFRHRSSLYRHQMMHLGMAYRCDSCGIVMNRKDNLLTHKRRYCMAHKQKMALMSP